MKYKYDAALPEGSSEEEVRAVLEARGATWAERFSAGTQQLAEAIWALPEQRGEVRYIFDHYVEVPYLRAESDIVNEPTKILSDLGSELTFLYVDDLVDEVGPASPTRRYALRALAATTTIYRGDVVAAFKAAIHDPELEIRQLSIDCVARYSSFVFAKELDAQAAVESNEALKQRQVKLAEGLRTHGKRGTLW